MTTVLCPAIFGCFNPVVCDVNLVLLFWAVLTRSFSDPQKNNETQFSSLKKMCVLADALVIQKPLGL